MKVLKIFFLVFLSSLGHSKNDTSSNQSLIYLHDNAKQKAISLAHQDAVADLAAFKNDQSKKLVFLSIFNGWVPKVAGVSVETWNDCLSKHVNEKIIAEYGDNIGDESERYELESLITNPKTSYIYAYEYNKTLLLSLKGQNIFDCL